MKIKRFWQNVKGNDISSLILRLLVVYVILFILQITFYVIDKPYIGDIADFHEAKEIVAGALQFDTLSILWTNCLFILLSILPFRFREKKWYQQMLFWIYLVFNTVFLIILNCMDVVYFPQTMKRFTSEEFHYFNNGNSFTIVVDYIKNNLALIIIALALINLLAIAWRHIKYNPSPIVNKRKYYVANTIAAVVILILMVAGMRGTFSLTKPWKPLSFAAKYAPEKTWVTLTNPYCVIRTFDKDKFDRVDYFDEKELDALYIPEHDVDSSRYNLGKRNVVVFIMESFSKEHSKLLNPDLYPKEAGFTPFLDSLMQEGYTFTHAYSNGMKSIEAMPSVYASIPSLKTSFALMHAQHGDFEAMPEILAKQGYQTAFFSGGDRNSMGFEDVAKMFGVQRCYCREEYEASYPVNENTIEPYWGVFDMPYFQFMADELDKMQEPFFASVFNLSSHHPFRVPSDYEEVVPYGHTPEQRVVAYTDLSFRKLFQRIKDEPWFNNTIFVFVADHVAPLTYDPQTLTLKGRSAIIEFIYTPDGSLHGMDDATVQQLDIMPTVLGLIGYDKPYFAFGRDVFNEPERGPVAINCLNQIYQCITDSVTIYYDTESVVRTIGEDKNQKAETFLKAFLQRYSESLSEKKYTVAR